MIRSRSRNNGAAAGKKAARVLVIVIVVIGLLWCPTPAISYDDSLDYDMDKSDVIIDADSTIHTTDNDITMTSSSSSGYSTILPRQKPHLTHKLHQQRQGDGRFSKMPKQEPTHYKAKTIPKTSNWPDDDNLDWLVDSDYEIDDTNSNSKAAVLQREYRALWHIVGALTGIDDLGEAYRYITDVHMFGLANKTSSSASSSSSSSSGSGSGSSSGASTSTPSNNGNNTSTSTSSNSATSAAFKPFKRRRSDEASPYLYSLTTDEQARLLQMRQESNHCDWDFVVCIAIPPPPVTDNDDINNENMDMEDIIVVASLNLPHAKLKGSLPSTLTSLRFLQTLDVSHNVLRGSIPTLFATMTYLKIVNVDYNQLTLSTEAMNYDNSDISINDHYYNRAGTNTATTNRVTKPLFPSVIALSIEGNLVSGSLQGVLETLLGSCQGDNEPTTTTTTTQNGSSSLVQLLDVSNNLLTGRIPTQYLVTCLPYLTGFWAASNVLTGPLPTKDRHENNGSDNDNDHDGGVVDLTALSHLSTLDLHGNYLTGPLSFASFAPSLRHLVVSHNALTGPLDPPYPHLPHLHALVVADNALTATIPVNYWSKLRRLGVLIMSRNRLTGTLPIAFMTGQAASLGLLDVSGNRLTGTIATELGLMSALHTISASGNLLSGTIPNEMMGMNPNLRLNFTNNLLTGTIPALFCGHGASSMNMLYRDFGCDAVLCRPKTFNIHGHATLHSACRPCTTIAEHEPDMVHILGRTTCKGVDFVYGDFDGDGSLHAREILRMIYIDTLGRFWGQAYQSWADVRVNECDLLGITCVNGKVARIDLTGAELCSNGDRRPGPIQYCYGLPAEIGQLSTLEVFQLTRRQFLRGTIPTTIGKLSLLRLLDISACTSMSGTLPTELGRLTNLKRLMLSHSRFRGTIPTEILSLGLEKLYLTNNLFTGSLSTLIGKLTSVKEFMISRNAITGSIPTQVGRMTRLENFEAYHNQLVSSIPRELALPNLKRIDVFGNKLNGTIPEELARLESLQILHVKENRLTGTLSSSFGELPFLSWLDVSGNGLAGTIPPSLGDSTSIDDFRAAENMLYGSIPSGLCANTKLNAGSAKRHGCHGVLCPVGTYCETGFANVDEVCLPCPDGSTSLYLGSTSCVELGMNDFLAMLYEVTHTSLDPFDDTLDMVDDTHSICDWQGVFCDEDGQATSLMFPLHATVDE